MLYAFILYYDNKNEFIQKRNFEIDRGESPAMVVSPHFAR